MLIDWHGDIGRAEGLGVERKTMVSCLLGKLRNGAVIDSLRARARARLPAATNALVAGDSRRSRTDPHD
jgi:hypothetical protein